MFFRILHSPKNATRAVYRFLSSFAVFLFNFFFASPKVTRVIWTDDVQNLNGLLLDSRFSTRYLAGRQALFLPKFAPAKYNCPPICPEKGPAEEVDLKPALWIWAFLTLYEWRHNLCKLCFVTCHVGRSKKNSPTCAGCRIKTSKRIARISNYNFCIFRGLN